VITGLAIRALLAGLVIAGGTGRLATDLDGNPIDQLVPPGSRAVVLFFAASDCPVSNRYIPEIQHLAKEFEPRGVRVWFVYPNPGDDAKVVRAHDAEYAIHPRTALDTAQTIVQMAHVTITPEAAIFVPQGSGLQGSGLREVYRGRIDDRYIAFGQERPQARHHDLEEAIRAVLAGRPVPQPGGPPVGCSIVTLHP
jgi:thiol-disulfide isomerase/thioredoxin